MEIEGKDTETEDTAMKTCKHTPKPDGYLQQIEWRIEMSRKGFVQHQCKACGAWAIWKKERIVKKTLTVRK